jgi:hypothetical protein
MPCDGTVRPPAGVVLMSAEDGAGDTLRPRLEEAGANLSRVAVLTGVRAARGTSRPLSLPRDLSAVREAIVTVGARLVVVDPLMAFLASEVDSHRDQDVRCTLSRVADLAGDTGAAVLLVRHLTKGGSGNPLYRGGGSIGIIGAARAGLLLAADPRDSGRRILAGTKNNLAPLPPSLAFRLVPSNDVATVSWDGHDDTSAADLVAIESPDRSDAVSGASAFLRELLKSGPMATAAVKAEAQEAGVNWRAVERAKHQAGVRCYRMGGLGAEGRWYMELRSHRPGGHGGLGGDGRDRQNPGNGGVPGDAKGPNTDKPGRGGERER